MHSFGIDRMPLYRQDHGVPHSGKFAGLVRVSTDKQEVENQVHLIKQYLNGGEHTINWFKEEGITGSTPFIRRPVLQQALEYCRKEGATLIITSLSRLSRTNWEATKFFSEEVHKKGFKMVVLDNPQLDHKTVGFFAQMNYNERITIQERTLASLNRIQAEIKEKGLYKSKAGNIVKKLGRSDEVLKKARKKAKETTQQKANQFAQELYPEIKALLDAGYSYRGIAKLFNKTNRVTGGSKDDKKQFSWYASTISNIVKRSA
jgi:DNA invertase Pin-like site-specific DNA recombinase